MIRLIAFLVGIGFAGVALISLIAGMGPAFSDLSNYGRFVKPTVEHEFHKSPKPIKFQHDGPFGTWDAAQLQRGYQVYKEVCSSCHSLKYVAFRDLEQLGYSPEEVKALAAEWTNIRDIDSDTGEAITRPGLPTDTFPAPYPNNVAAATANNGVAPPDLSLMTKARPNGTAYVNSLLTGYGPIPAELKEQFPEFSTPDGGHFNEYFPNLNLAMAPPLTLDGQVSYADGTEATIPQMAADVSAFLTWTAEPSLVERKQRGWPVVLFLLFATVLAYFAKKHVWSDTKPKKAD
ncbi:cytochrome c1 [Pontixanthobacter aquaemixtae]|uniref:Cytochrome c1 n=1 Tax=Pontixanthobacter aquaemixtae TaxID=1958940 RepID=A0A844ZU72_9SPHN|nr:cytochrome c1 [Pontixanthobacter aquaemixtae]MXO91288.1 cytochrome c1 [Pontixanthobacter aquaemixtae]